MKPVFNGSCTAMITPFDENGRIDFDALEKQTEFQIENGTDALLVLGTTGEAATLSDDEKKQVVDFSCKTISKRVPLIVGAGSNNTQKALEFAEFAEKAGADAHLQVTPYYNKTTQAGLVAHYTYIADRVNIPMILYNVPSRTGLNILPQTYGELSKHPRISAVKEANGNVAAVAETMRVCGNNFSVYSGDDALITPFLAMGARGVISVLSNILPREIHDICRLYSEGKTKESAEMQIALSDIISAMFIETNPMPVKAAMHLFGRDSGHVRLPLTDISDKSRIKLRSVLADHGLMGRGDAF